MNKTETVKTFLRVDRKEINYLRTTLESYDGMAVVRTIDPFEACIEVMMSPGCEDLVFELLCSLREREGLHIQEAAKKKDA